MKIYYRENKNCLCLDLCKFIKGRDFEYIRIGSFGCQTCKYHIFKNRKQQWIICKKYNDELKINILLEKYL